MVSNKHHEIIKVLDENNIAHSTKPTTVWSDSGRILPYQDETEEYKQKKFTNCCNNDAISILHGKLYRCPFQANGVNLKAIPQEESEEVDLIDGNIDIVELREKIRKVCYGKKYLTACSYCNGRDYSTLEIPAAIQTKTPRPFERI